MTKPHIVLPGALMPYIMERLDGAFTVHRLWQAEDADAMINSIAGDVRGAASHAFSAELMDRLPNLEIISNFGVGYDGVDAAHAAKKGIVVTNTPGVLTEEVADTAFGLLLMTVRELSAAERYLRAGNWEREGDYPLTRGSLAGKTLGILGLGRIGKAVARRAEAFGLKIAYHGRSKQADVPYAYHDTVQGLANAVDILVSVLPGGENTRHLINAGVMAALGPDGVLINIGRGSVVDEAALIETLRSGALGAAGLDVFEKEPHIPAELMELDRVVLLPHVGSASVHTRNRMGQLVVDNLTSWFSEGRAITPVPECEGLASRA